MYSQSTIKEAYKQNLNCDKCKIFGSRNKLNITDCAVVGAKNVCTGSYNTIKGDENHCNGDFNEVIGNGNRSSGYRTIITGNRNVVFGDYCIVKGDHNIVHGKYASVEGKHNSVLGEHSTTNAKPVEEVTMPDENEEELDEECEDGDVECVICRSNKPVCVIIPCMDLHLCVKCSRNLMQTEKPRCPICRCKVKMIKRVHCG